MNTPERLIPRFDFHAVVIDPWTQSPETYAWIVVMGFLVAATCGWVGQYLILRRMALVGDAISHSVLVGIAGAFLITGSRASIPMFIGALVAGLLTTVLIELIHRKSRVKQDAAIGVTFSTLFALGVVMISMVASSVDLDPDCVLYGEISHVPLETPVSLGGWTVGPPSVVRATLVALLTLSLITLFYKELLVSSFDPGLAYSMGIRASWVHYGLMTVLSVVVVSAFESVGAILVVAMLILPGATASLLSHRLPVVLACIGVVSALSSLLGLHLALWLDCQIAPAMAVAGTGLFLIAWSLTLVQAWRQRHRRASDPSDPIPTQSTP